MGAAIHRAQNYSGQTGLSANRNAGLGIKKMQVINNEGENGLVGKVEKRDIGPIQTTIDALNQYIIAYGINHIGIDRWHGSQLFGGARIQTGPLGDKGAWNTK